MHSEVSYKNQAPVDFERYTILAAFCCGKRNPDSGLFLWHPAGTEPQAAVALAIRQGNRNMVGVLIAAGRPPGIRFRTDLRQSDARA